MKKLNPVQMKYLILSLFLLVSFSCSKKEVIQIENRIFFLLQNENCNNLEYYSDCLFEFLEFHFFDTSYAVYNHISGESFLSDFHFIQDSLIFDDTISYHISKINGNQMTLKNEKETLLFFSYKKPVQKSLFQIMEAGNYPPSFGDTVISRLDNALITAYNFSEEDLLNYHESVLEKDSRFEEEEIEIFPPRPTNR